MMWQQAATSMTLSSSNRQVGRKGQQTERQGPHRKSDGLLHL